MAKPNAQPPKEEHTLPDAETRALNDSPTFQSLIEESERDIAARRLVPAEGLAHGENPQQRRRIEIPIPKGASPQDEAAIIEANPEFQKLRAQAYADRAAGKSVTLDDALAADRAEAAAKKRGRSRRT